MNTYVKPEVFFINFVAGEKFATALCTIQGSCPNLNVSSVASASCIAGTPVDQGFFV